MNFYRRFPYTNLNDINLDWIIKKVKALIGLVDEKQDKPDNAGTAGQVLGLDENLNPVWLDQTGGGGTTNYNNLLNKPRIESVTLSGNKTAAELGLAKITEIPSPASSGTPEMDGTASNGASSHYARADHVHPTDTTRAAAALLETYVRPNLLDNWYFVGGGSQLGYGRFPINQRGQTVYQTVGASAIDRWKLNTAGAPSVTITSDGLTLATGSDSGEWCLLQDVAVSSLVGKTLTATIKVESITGQGFVDIYMNPVSSNAVTFTAPGVYSTSTTIPAGTTRIRFVIGAPSSMVVSAVKLEIGTTQTLTHLVNDVWVLNEVPDYPEQLAKCQAYYIRFTNYTAPGYITTGSTAYRMKITLPVSMARVPTPVISSYVCRLVTGAYSAHTGAYPGSAPTTLWVDPNYGTSNFSIQDTISEASTDLNNAPCVFEIYGLELSAE